MKNLQAGFGRMDITPMLEIPLRGYFALRKAQGVLDSLEVNALVLANGEDRVVLLSLDNCGIKQDLGTILRTTVAKAVGLPAEAIYLHTTHTHTGPETILGSGNPLVEKYIDFLQHRLIAVTRQALEDLKPTKMGWGVGQAPGIAFVRRYRMKDGSIQTNPGVNNPQIAEPVGQVDERVNVLRFDQEQGSSLILINFGNHPDTVGGCRISSDWPGFARRTVEKVLDNTRCIFFNGAQGDVNHVNVHPKGGDMNGMFLDFDDVSRGYEHTKYMGRVVAGAVLQVYDKVAWTQSNEIRFLRKTIQVPSNMPQPEQLPQARHIYGLHQQGRDAELPYQGMMLTTMVAEAKRMLTLEHGPESFTMELAAISIGNIAFACIPGEAFTELGRSVKRAPGWDLVIPCGLTNGYEGYFPTMDAYEQGGYEARSSPFRAGVSELLLENMLQLLESLRNKQQVGEKL